MPKFSYNEPSKIEKNLLKRNTLAVDGLTPRNKTEANKIQKTTVVS